MAFVAAAHALNDLAAGLSPDRIPLRAAADQLNQMASETQPHLLTVARALEALLAAAGDWDREQCKRAAALAKILRHIGT